MKNTILTLTTIIIITLIGCQKMEIAENKQTNDLSHNYLTFESADEYFETCNRLVNMSSEERRQWEKTHQFISLKTHLENVYEQLENAKDKNEFMAIIEKNKDIVRIDEEGKVVSQTPVTTYTYVVNREGVFYVNSYQHRVCGSKITISNNQKKIDTYEYISDAKICCGMRKSANVEKESKHGWRKIDFEMKVTKMTIICCEKPCYEVYLTLKIVNYKKNILGNWTTYKTICYMNDISYKIRAPKVIGYNGIHSIFEYRDYQNNIASITSGNSEVYELIATYQIGDRVENISIEDPYFKKAYGKAQNRGVWDLWADIQCNECQ